MIEIIEPGIGILTNAEYHADPCPVPSLSASISVDLLTRSPLHAWHAHPRLNPDHEPEERGDFDLGSAAHALLLEGEDRMIACPFDDWRKKDAQAMRDDARAAGKHPVLTKTYDAVFLMREAALRKLAECPDLAGVSVAELQAELSMFWKEGETWLRARSDWMTAQRDVFIDYKTTKASANPDSWGRTMAGMSGDIQASFALRGSEALGGPTGAKWLWLVQEVQPPFACSLIGFSPAYRAFGDSRVERAIGDWRECLRTDRWPAYPSRIAWIEPPAWAMNQEMEREAAHPFGIEQDGEAYGDFMKGART